MAGARSGPRGDLALVAAIVLATLAIERYIAGSLRETDRRNFSLPLDRISSRLVMVSGRRAAHGGSRGPNGRTFLSGPIGRSTRTGCSRPRPASSSMDCLRSSQRSRPLSRVMGFSPIHPRYPIIYGRSRSCCRKDPTASSRIRSAAYWPRGRQLSGRPF